MTLFPLASVCRTVAADAAGRSEALCASLRPVFDRHGVAAAPAFELEAILFIFWSIEIGMLNCRTWWLDRWLALRFFRSALRRTYRHFPEARLASVDEPVGFYRHRYRDALHTIHNIYVARGKKGQLIFPLTSRTARLFLQRSLETEFAVPDVVGHLVYEQLEVEARHIILAMLDAQPAPQPMRR